jgi:hypothetical protein
VVSRINRQLFLACISAAAISATLLAPYEIVNSLSLDEHHPSQSDPISKFDFEEDEFTGDAVPDLDNIDFVYHHR